MLNGILNTTAEQEDDIRGFLAALEWSEQDLNNYLIDIHGSLDVATTAEILADLEELTWDT